MDEQQTPTQPSDEEQPQADMPVDGGEEQPEGDAPEGDEEEQPEGGEEPQA